MQVTYCCFRTTLRFAVRRLRKSRKRHYRINHNTGIALIAIDKPIEYTLRSLFVYEKSLGMPRIGLGYGTRARFQTTGHCWQSPLEGDGELCSLATSSAHARHSNYVEKKMSREVRLLSVLRKMNPAHCVFWMGGSDRIGPNPGRTEYRIGAYQHLEPHL
jgi:hypothetical protein